MSRRDYIGEILEKRGRLSSGSPRWEQVWERANRIRKVVGLLDLLEPASELMTLLEDTEAPFSELRDLEIDSGDIRYEMTRYVPIGFVACTEGYFRLAYADLIDYGAPFRDNASKFDIKFSIQMAVSLQRHSVSLGEFVAHLLTTNRLADINYNMSTIIEDDFLGHFRETRPKLETQQRLFEVDDDDITNRVLADVQRLFDLRHMYCHEVNPPIEYDDMSAILSGVESVMEFLWVSESIVNELLNS